MVQITAPERELRRQDEIIDTGRTPVDDIWLNADICWRSLVGAGVGSEYLVGIDVT